MSVPWEHISVVPSLLFAVTNNGVRCGVLPEVSMRAWAAYALQLLGGIQQIRFGCELTVQGACRECALEVVSDTVR